MLGSPTANHGDADVNLDRWQRIDKIVQDALERAPQERAQFLESVCADDPSIRQEAQTLIRSFELAGNFLEFPAPGSITGRTFGQYEIKRLIGSGGMGQVYLGWIPS